MNISGIKHHTVGWLSLAVLLLLVGCSENPQPINYGSDQCAHCKMVITEQAFAAELITDKGKAYKYDAIECLAAYLQEHPEHQNPSATRWVHDFANPEQWIKAESALFVQSKEIQSPMGLSLLAFNQEEALNEHLEEYPGKQITWSDINSQVKDKW